MRSSFEIAVRQRRPFVFGRVSALLRFRRMALRSGIKPLRNLSKFLVKLWCRALRRPLRGSFGIEMNDSVRWIRVDSHNSHLETVLAWPLGSYEPAVCAVIDAFLPDDGTFYDIGANWGYYSLFVASRAGFRGQIHAFEPYPPTAADLDSVLSQAGFGNRIVSHKVALSDTAGEARMVVPHRVKVAQAAIGDRHTTGVSVPTVPLDSLALPAPDLIKLDVEGHELEALHGGRETLARDKPVIVFENWPHVETLEKTLAPLHFLEQLGFRILAPYFDPGSSEVPAPLRLVEISAATRLDFPDFVDLCAIHPERMDALGLKPAR